MTERSKNLIDQFEAWCKESQIENTFCTQAKKKLAEMIDQEMLLSRVVVPSDEELLKRNQKYIKANKSSKNTFDCLDFAYYHGQLDFIDDLKDNLKLVPLTSEQVEKLLPDLCELNEMLVATIKEVNEYNDKNVSTRNLKSDAEVLLPKLRDFISKRLAGM